MKKLFTVTLIAFILAGCTDKKAQKQAALDDVIKIHDKVMAADEHLMKNKMQLDSLLKLTNFPAKDTAVLLRSNLNIADSAMENWMHKFDPDYKAKSDDETLTYFTSQKKQIAAIDSELNRTITASDKYLQKLKTK